MIIAFVTRAVFVWPWNDYAQTKQEQQTNAKISDLIGRANENKLSRVLIGLANEQQKRIKDSRKHVLHNTFWSFVLNILEIVQSWSHFPVLRLFTRKQMRLLFRYFQSLAGETNKQTNIETVFQGHAKVALIKVLWDRDVRTFTTRLIKNNKDAKITEAGMDVQWMIWQWLLSI